MFGIVRWIVCVLSSICILNICVSFGLEICVIIVFLLCWNSIRFFVFRCLRVLWMGILLILKSCVMLFWWIGLFLVKCLVMIVLCRCLVMILEVEGVMFRLGVLSMERGKWGNLCGVGDVWDIVYECLVVVVVGWCFLCRCVGWF